MAAGVPAPAPTSWATKAAPQATAAAASHRLAGSPWRALRTSNVTAARAKTAPMAVQAGDDGLIAGSLMRAIAQGVRAPDLPSAMSRYSRTQLAEASQMDTEGRNLGRSCPRLVVENSSTRLADSAISWRYRLRRAGAGLARAERVGLATLVMPQHFTVRRSRFD